MINAKVYETLPDDLKRTLLEVGKQCHLNNMYENELADADALELFPGKGVKIIHFTDAEKARIKQMYFIKMQEDWVKQADANGLAGSRLVAKIKELAPDIAKQNPPLSYKQLQQYFLDQGLSNE